MVNKNVRQIRSQNDTNLLHSESMYQTQIIQIAILQMRCKSRVRSLVTTSSFPFCLNWRWIRNIPFHPVTRSHPLERQGPGADTLKTTQPHPPASPRALKSTWSVANSKMVAAALQMSREKLYSSRVSGIYSNQCTNSKQNRRFNSYWKTMKNPVTSRYLRWLKVISWHFPALHSADSLCQAVSAPFLNWQQ